MTQRLTSYDKAVLFDQRNTRWLLDRDAMHPEAVNCICSDQRNTRRNITRSSEFGQS